MTSRSRWVLGAIAAFLAVSVAVAGRSPRASADERVPADGAEVLERVPPRGADEARAARSALERDPRDVRAAVALARTYIRRSRATGDPRYLGRAQAALSPWWDADPPPLDVLVLRATIRQSLHDFEPALRDLDRAAKLAPGNPQVWLTRATVLTVRARYPEARESCMSLTGLADRLVIITCLASVDGVTGRAKAARDGLAAALGRGGATRDVEAWAEGLIAELSERIGDMDGAERAFARTLEIDPEDAYTRGASADMRIDQRRWAEAIALVRGQEANDGLLLRLAIAERGADDPAADAHIAVLADRFAKSRLRGDSVHRREEARFELLRGDGRRALELAKANFEVQREPWDVRVLLAAAVAARDPEGARAARDHVAAHKLEHPEITRLIKALESM
jgi:tetratricopeptide (TPR) repeat protein